MAFNIAEILGTKTLRNLIVERAAVTDAEKRIVKLSFSSDAPVEQYFGTLELSHAAGCARLDRINSAGAFLRNHDRNQRLGKVARAWIENGKGYAEIKVSRNALGEEFWRDLEDDCLIGTSFGFLVYKIDEALSDFKNNRYVATDWEPFEITDESIPADVSVGVNRSAQAADEQAASIAENNNSQLSESSAPATDAEITPKENQMEPEEIEQNQAASTEAARASEVVAFATIYGERALAETMLLENGGVTVDAVRAAIKAKRAASAPALPVAPAANIAIIGGGTNAGAAQAAARVISRAQLKAFRGPDAEESATRFGHFLGAALFGGERSKEFCRAHGITVRRAHSEADNESGGFLVPTEFENVMIDLRLEYGVFRRNANVTPMASETKERPRRKGGLKAYPIGAKGASRRLTESKKGWDRVGLTAKKWGVLAKYEEELSEDAVISMGDDLASEIAYAFTQTEDECGFYGDGTSEYHGIVGVIPKLISLSQTIGNIASLQLASGNQWSEIQLIDILGVVGKTPSFARRAGQIKWYCTNEFWATVLCRLALTAGGTTTMDINGEMVPAFLGKPVELVEVMPHVEANSSIPLLYGNLAQAAMFGDRRGVTIKMTDSNDTDFEEDHIAIKGTERFDINVHDVGNADATPAKRQAGPIVGLVMQGA